MSLHHFYSPLESQVLTCGNPRQDSISEMFFTLISTENDFQLETPLKAERSQWPPPLFLVM
ncbi:hypothetical protein TIFTF001_001415 [Ficus carica]|uniref:Uncharacterized protein n=1 Tax=Ficus carica TaxID=3494 RepID=A0AA87YZU9_FICCA|nr:hypothetical protein TIFTF001_001415 [Ficus carica]